MTSAGAYDRDVVARMVDLIGTRLSVPIQPYPVEGLADVLYRAACANGYQATSMLGRALGLQKTKRMTPESLARANIEHRAVADLLGTRRPTDAVGLICPKLDEAGTRILFFGREVRAKGFFVSHRRVAPRSLQLEPYQRAAWSVAGLGFDPETREMLLSRCPICGERPGFDVAIEIEYCSSCHVRGRTVNFGDCQYLQERVHVDDEEALSFATNLIDPRVPADDTEIRKVARDLRHFGPGQLFQLIVGMATNLERISTGEPASERQSPAPGSLAAAARAVLDWPRGFQMFAENLRLLYLKRPAPARQRGYHPMRGASLSVGPDLRKMVLDCAQEARHSALYSGVASIAAPSVGNGLNGTCRIEEEGLWQARRGKPGLPGLERVLSHCLEHDQQIGQVEAAYMFLIGSPQVQALSSRWGVPLPFVQDLFGVTTLEHASTSALMALTHASGPANTLEPSIVEVGLPGSPPTGAIPLWEAVSALCARPINPWPDVFVALKNRRIACWMDPRNELSLVDRVYVSDFDALRDILSGVAEGDHIPRRKADLHAVASVLGLSALRCASWQRRGIVSIHPTFTDLWVARESFITTSEVQRRLVMNGAAAAKLLEISREISGAGCVTIGPKARKALITLHRRADVEAHYGARLAKRAVAPRVD